MLIIYELSSKRFELLPALDESVGRYERGMLSDLRVGEVLDELSVDGDFLSAPPRLCGRAGC